jgi:[ribosomal protein S5]-alanine N-acetyltransferase
VALPLRPGHLSFSTVFAPAPGRRPPIETKRLVLRLPELSDVPALIEYHRANRDHLQPWWPTWPPDIFEAGFWQAQVRQRRTEFVNGRGCAMFVFEKRGGALVGSLSLNQIARGASHSCSIGYGLAESAQGHGYMVEAVRAAVDFAFRDLHLHRVTACYIPHNRRSGNVLRSAGFTVEGYARDYLCIDGRWEDHVMTALVNPEWA